MSLTLPDSVVFQQDAKAAEEVHAANRKTLQEAGFMPMLLTLALESLNSPAHVRCHVRCPVASVLVL